MSAPQICGYNGRSGRGGDGASIRVYTQAECDAKDGNWSQNGECLYKNGGSISYDCREVNNDPIGMLYENRYYVGGALVVGGLLYWRMSRQR